MRLTEREREILLRKCRDGETTAQIAFALFLQPQTVKNCLTALYQRLDPPNGRRTTNGYTVCYRYGFADARRRNRERG